MAKRKHLLEPAAPVAGKIEPAVELRHIGVEEIYPTPANPRETAQADNDPDLDSLAASIKEHGVLKPILVRPMSCVGSPPILNGYHYQIIAGERRWRATRRAFGRSATIPAIIRSVDDHLAMELTVVENLEHETLSPLEEAAGIATLVGDGWEIERIAARLGREKGWVARRARLVNLSANWRDAIKLRDQFRSWGAQHLDLVARLEHAGQDEFLASIESWHRPGEWSVKDLDERLAEFARLLSSAKWSLDDAGLVPKAGACSACSKRSSCRPGLFDEPEDAPTEANDRCLDATCWDRKVEAHLVVQEAQLREKHPDLVLISPGYGNGGTRAAAKNVLSRLEFHDAKKSTPGAVKALVVEGPKRGETQWVVPGDARRQLGTDRPAKKKDPDAPQKSVAEKRAELEARRRKSATESLIDWLCDATKRPAIPDRDLVTLAAWIGMGGGMQGSPGEGLDGVQALNHLWGEPDEARVNVADWVMEALQKRWSYAYNLERFTKDVWPEVIAVANKLGATLTLNAALREAAEEIQEPASWARQEEEEREAAKAKQPDRRARASGDADATVGDTPKSPKPKKAKPKPAARASR